MKATRTVPGRPVNDSSSTTAKIIGLVAATLDRSPNFDANEVRAELGAAEAAIGLLAVSGHLRRGELVLVTPGLRLRIDVPVGEDALGATEYTDTPRGAATADGWTLHLPEPETLASVVKAASRSCPHVSTEPAPTEAPARTDRDLTSTIDLSRLANWGGRS